MSQYCYSPLAPDANSIRLLRLLPQADGGAESKIQCEIFEYPLQDSAKSSHLYDALSYTWGGGELPCSITIGGQILNVTANLYLALLHLRDQSLERILWIDAICIDQNNLEERSQQVQVMALIYSKARCVLVWLGETADDVEGALEGIQLAAHLGDKSIDIPNERIPKEAIWNLLRRQWFQRVWV